MIIYDLSFKIPEFVDQRERKKVFKKLKIDRKMDLNCKLEKDIHVENSLIFMLTDPNAVEKFEFSSLKEKYLPLWAIQNKAEKIMIQSNQKGEAFESNI